MREGIYLIWIGGWQLGGGSELESEGVRVRKSTAGCHLGRAVLGGEVP